MRKVFRSSWPFIPVRKDSAIEAPRAAAQQILEWINQSEQTPHQQGYSEGNDSDQNLSPLPTRILEVVGPEKVRLHIAAHAEKAQYACLSHCWGGVTALRLTSLQLEAFQDEIPWHMIPQTFRDALTLLPLIGLKYLWIDSLCITQDDTEDWLAEGSKMASTYERSYITIAASRSPNPHGGLFNTSTSYQQAEQISLSNSADSSQTFYVRRVPQSSSDLPLLRRAWFYQERKLSSRVVHFGCEGLEWETAFSHLQELKLNNSELTGTTDKDEASYSYQNYIEIGEFPLDSTLRLEQWHNLVSEYTRMDLSFASDIFPALQGVARQFSRHKSGRYLAGLWEDTCLRDLFWFPVEDSQTVQPYRAPTWSWASRTGPIDWLSFSPFHVPPNALARSGNKVLTECTPLATIVNIETKPLGQDEMGPIRAAKLHIDSPCFQLPEFEWHDTGHTIMWDCEPLGRKTDLGDVWLLPVFRIDDVRDEQWSRGYDAPQHSPQDHLLFCLMLECCADKDQYRRVGIIQLAGRMNPYLEGFNSRSDDDSHWALKLRNISARLGDRQRRQIVTIV